METSEGANVGSHFSISCAHVYLNDAGQTINTGASSAYSKHNRMAWADLPQPISSAMSTRPSTFLPNSTPSFWKGSNLASMAAAAFFASKGARGARVVAILGRASAV